jgi:hypothetical protein
VLQKALLSSDVIATEITIIVPIKVILNEQYVILMFQYLGEESCLISSNSLAHIQSVISKKVSLKIALNPGFEAQH